MERVLEELQTERFWVGFALVFTIVSGLLSRLADAVESGEIAANSTQRRWLIRAAALVADALRRFNAGPRSWTGVLLAALAAGAALLSGCAALQDVSPRDAVDAVCVATGDAIVADPHADPQLWRDLAVACDVLLGVIEHVEEAR